MFSARAFVGWYNGLPENREVSLGSPQLPLPSHLSAKGEQLLDAGAGEEGAMVEDWKAPGELRGETSGW